MIDKWLVLFGVALIISVAGIAFDQHKSSDAGLSIVSKTEYVPLDEGQVISEFRNLLTRQPINATCYASILYPNKTAFITDQNMQFQSGPGTHYINFSVPNVEGVYEYQARCEYNGINYTTSKAFHVSSSFRLLQEDIHSLVSFLPQGTDEVQWGKSSRNGWKLVSDYVQNISALTCRIQPLDQDAIISYDENFDVSPAVTLVNGGTSGYGNQTGFYNNWVAGTYTQIGQTDSLVVLGTSYLTTYSNLIDTDSGRYGMGYADRNISFFPSEVFADHAITGNYGSTPFGVAYMAFFYYNSSDGLLGTVYLENPTGSPFNNCAGGIPPPGDNCGLYNQCWGTIPSDTYCLVGSTSESWDVNLLNASAEAGINPQDVSYVTIRTAHQNRADQIGSRLDNLIVIAEPIGYEFIDQNAQNFGVNWTADRVTTVSWRDYRIKCAVVYELETGIKAIDGLEQFVFISNQDRLGAAVAHG